MKIYERIYDNPLNEDGTKKENKFLGDFKIIDTIEVDVYSSKRIGVKRQKIYFIEEMEVHYRNAGTKFRITELKGLTPKCSF